MVRFLMKIIFLLFTIMPYNVHGYKRHVYVLNNLPQNSPKLKVHCASGDDDLGYHYPKVGEDFDWEFNAWSNTLFFCYFWWGDKDNVFDVFNSPNFCVKDASKLVPQYPSKCYWKVMGDGFYLGYEDNNGGKIIYQKYRDW
ncbi:hypothetical protein T459_26302 [Capsicum annuum]|uniref:S-protein homolog n=1 Tax=Capsicum annuum TaxID=4072 RepID=A0A2G2YN80_CAPAN|nr:hypothetical protein T459_26302 [Capsicum annuum]